MPTDKRLLAAILSIFVQVRVDAQQPELRADAEPAPIARAVAPPPGPYAEGFDALHYDIALELPAAGTTIRGRTTVTVRLQAPRMRTLALDLTGLIVDGVQVQDEPVPFGYDAGKIRVPMPAAARVGDAVRVTVLYHGQPDDGLIIQQNVHGDRGAFADNWPDRARFWFPCIDHPSDKATAAFAISAPAEWTVLANGTHLPADRPADLFPGTPNADEPRRVWHWRTERPIPTYTMVIGAARFATGPPVRACAAKPCVDVTWWSFPADAASMERSVRRAGSMLDYFAQLVGPFEYEKLAHVESSTMFGGMENASAIFYPEKAIADGQDIESTVAHETAHQWFGDSVTIGHWHDLWLSEGFATYFGAIFFQHSDGEAAFRSMMHADREAYLKSDVVTQPVIDPAQQDLLAMLNANSYQKGGWILHMLRNMIGDRAFFNGVRTYYRRHRHGNASTGDLQAALERSANRQLGWFFRQWLYEPGFPRLRRSVEWNAERREVSVTIEQTQPAAWPTFRLPLVIQLSGATAARHTVELTARHQVFRFRARQPPAGVELDPDADLLTEIEP